MGVDLLRGVEEVLRLALIGGGVVRVVRPLHHDLLDVLVLDVDPDGVVMVHPRDLPALLQSLGFVVDLHWRTAFVHGLQEVVLEDGNQLIDRLPVLDVLDFLHVPGQPDEGWNLKGKKKVVFVIPQADVPINRNGQRGHDLQLELECYCDCLLVGLHQSHIDIRPLYSLILIQDYFLDCNIFIGDDLCFFKHGLDGVVVLLGGNIKFLVYFSEWKLNQYPCLIRQKDIMFLEALLFLNELIPHGCKLAIFQLGRQVFFDAEVYLAVACPLHEVKLILIREQHEQIVVGFVMEVEDEALFVLLVVLGEAEAETPFNMVLVVLHLIDQLVCGKEGEGLRLRTESRLAYSCKPLQEDSIDEVEVVIPVIPHLRHRILPHDHQVLQIVVIEAADSLINIDLLLITAVLPLHHLLLPVYLIQVEIVIEHKERRPPHEEAEMLLEVRTVETVAPPDFSAEEGEGDDLVVDGEEELLLAVVDVEVGQEGVLNPPLDCDLLLRHHDLVGLVDRELVLGDLGDAEGLVLGLHDVSVTHLLVHRPSGLVHQSDVVVLVGDDDGVEVGEDLEVRDDLVDGEGPDLGGVSAAANGKDSDDLLPPTQVELVLLIGVLEVLDLLHMHELAEFDVSQVLVEETDLITGNDTDAGERNHFQGQFYTKLIGIDGQFGHHLLRLRTNSLHVEQVKIQSCVRYRQPFIQHLNEEDISHRFRQGEDEFIHGILVELRRGFAEKMRDVDGCQGFIRKYNSQSGGNFGVVEVEDKGKLIPMLLLLGGELGDVLHIMVVDLDRLIAFIEAEGHPEVPGVAYSFDAIVMEEVVLLLPLLDLHLELRVLLLLLDADQLPQDVAEEGGVVDGLTALLGDLVEHVLESHHVVGTLLEGEPHHAQHQDHEVLQLHLSARQALELPLDQLQLAVEDQSADLRGGVLGQGLHVAAPEKLLSEVEQDLHAFLALYHVTEGCLLFDRAMFLLESQLLELLALEALHQAIIIKLYQVRGD